ncbi:bZIP transcription factor 27-like [Papaver somniferum]|uniref:bZIP transcription factor 27-like n=1 Tax=Papaver somniferum TaxID=3469 RepID=UPI000E6FC02B|nr:bZIP transcription factor 27-like [Papaver somniferum]
MWSSRVDDHGNRVSSSSSEKSLSSSSPSSSHSSILRNPRRKTMEEVWNNINLTCIHHKNTTNTSSSPIRVEDSSIPLPKPKATSQTFPVISNLQEFLARPFNKDSQSHQKQQPKTGAQLISRFSTSQVHPPPPPPPPPPPVPVPAAQPQPLPPTINLNSVCDQQFPYLDDNSDEHPLRPNPRLNHNNLSFIDSPSFVSALNTSHPFDQAFGNSTLPNNKRRASDETDDNNINCTGDRRHKRMIKNRESAARSRARKQAYTNELELEVANLMEENAMLRKQQQQLYLAAAAHQLPKKTTLQRTSTAPF